MRRSSTQWNLFSAVGALGLLVGAAACGDDSPGMPDANGGGDAAGMEDAGVEDAGNVDALDPATLRAGTIAISEIEVTNPILPQGAPPLKGAAVSINYTDLSSVTVSPAYGSAQIPLGGCAVWIYNVGEDLEPAMADEGAVTISGGLSPIGTCSFDQGAGYVCPFAGGTMPLNTLLVASPTSGTASITWSTADEFADKDVAGMYVKLEGFANAENNGMFPIVQKPTDNSLVIANPAATNEAVGAGITPTYAIFAGAGPTPAGREFLDENSEITVQKEDGSIVAQFEAAVRAAGEGLQLDDNSAQPHLLPDTAVDEVTFSCGNSGNCGSAPEGGIVGFVLSGRTTDGDITGLDTGVGRLMMPAPESRYAVFQCRGNIGDTSITIPGSAMEAILSTKPNRIETRLLRINAKLDAPQTSVVVGHGLVGYTDTSLSQ